MMGLDKTTLLAAGVGLAVLALTIVAIDRAPKANVEASESMVESPSAAKILEGLDVSFEQYQAGFSAFVGCARTQGWSLEGEARLTRRNVYEYRFFRPTGASPSDDELQASADDLHHCRTTHFDAVQRGWELKMEMTEAERQEARDFIGACMRARGYDSPEHPTRAEMASAIRVIPGVTDPAERTTFNECAAAMQNAFDLRQGEIP